MNNCPNCGGTISNGKCEYCGTNFSSDFENFISYKIQELQNQKTLLQTQLLLNEQKMLNSCCNIPNPITVKY